MLIKQLNSSEIIPALDIAKRAFDLYIAPDYSAEGINTFYDFISPENIKSKLNSGHFFIWGAFEDEKMTGVVAVRDNNHISLFSVDPDWHYRGIGRRLMETAFAHVRRMGLPFITVNASPYAVPVYQKLGFKCTDAEQTTDGMRYTPMKAFLYCYCGHDCSRCVTYLATIHNNKNLRAQAKQFNKNEFGYDIPLSEIHCMGGRSNDIFKLCADCPWMKCCKERNIDACNECSEYPCKPLAEYQAKYVNKCNQI